MSDRRIYPPWPAAPGNNATILLYAWGPVARTTGSSVYTPTDPNTKNRVIDLVTITWLRNDQASAANGVRVYGLDDTGTFREVDLKNNFNAATIGSGAPVAVPALSAGQEYRVSLNVAHLKGGAIEYTAGATGPTNWNGCVAVDYGALVAVR